MVTMAIISAVAVPHYRESAQNYQLSMAAQRIVNDLALAQSRANFGSTAVTMTFNTAASTYQIIGMSDPDRPAQTYTVNLAGAPYQVTLTSASFGAAAQITFDGYGTPTQAGTVVITLGSQRHTITVDGTSGRSVIQ